MRTILSIIGLLVFVLIIGCKSEKLEKSHWYKGNLHTHSYWSDGDEFPEMIMDWYKTNQYHFVALSDHNTLAEGEKWKQISNESLFQQTFENYLSTFNQDSSIVYERSSDTLRVKLKTFEEYRPLFEEKDRFLIFPSEEVSDEFENKPFHLNATNIQKYVEPQGGGSISEVLQNNIDEVYKQRKETGVPMIVHINHPNFRDAISLNDMKQLSDNRFFEVFNGHPQVKNNGDENRMGTEEMWDLINIAYLNTGKPLLYGIATDDSHNYHQMGDEWSNAGRGWVVVKADSLSEASIINALEEGQFYASTGVKLDDVNFYKNVLELSISPETNTIYNIEFVGCTVDDTEPKVLSKVTGTAAKFNLNEDILYVRARITSDKPHGRPMKEMLFEKAWTQPVCFKK